MTGSKGRTWLPGGGYVTQPHTVFEVSGQVSIENRGVEPDIFVDIGPSDEIAGRDPQLERALAELTRLISAAQQ